MHRASVVVLSGVLAISACAAPIPSVSPPPPLVEGFDRLLAVGDIGSCEGTDDEAVAALAAARDGLIAVLGDIAYPDGTAEEFDQCFEPTWGPMHDRLRPVPGNHEYQTDGATAYFDYFGAVAGDPDQGWYAYELGRWLVLALNSNCGEIGGCDEGSAQYAFVEHTLTEFQARRVRDTTFCTLAYWHHPRYSSGRHPSDPRMDAIWDLLVAWRTELVLSGHVHAFERFVPIGQVREIIVGTGGRSLYPFEEPESPMTAVRNATTYGLLELILGDRGYTWEFLPAPGGTGTFTDAGSGTCD